MDRSLARVLHLTWAHDTLALPLRHHHELPFEHVRELVGNRRVLVPPEPRRENVLDHRHPLIVQQYLLRDLLAPPSRRHQHARDHESNQHRPRARHRTSPLSPPTPTQPTTTARMMRPHLIKFLRDRRCRLRSPRSSAGSAASQKYHVRARAWPAQSLAEG